MMFKNILGGGGGDGVFACMYIYKEKTKGPKLLDKFKLNHTKSVASFAFLEAYV